MELLNSITAFVSKFFQWWFTVMPWEQAIRVRNGKHVKLLGAGLYFKIPFIDAIYIQTTRMRMVDSPMQTVSTRDNSAVTIKSAIGYSIGNIEVLYKTLYHPETTLVSLTTSLIGEYVRKNDSNLISPENIEAFVVENLKPERYGLVGLTVKITTLATVKTFRLIQDSSNFYEQSIMEALK